MTGSTLTFPSRPMRVCLARARPKATGSTASKLAGVRDQVNPHLSAVRAGKHASRADVIFHVAAAEHTARIDIFESGEDLGRRTAHNVDDDVQPPPMAHGEHGLISAIV